MSGWSGCTATIDVRRRPAQVFVMAAVPASVVTVDRLIWRDGAATPDRAPFRKKRRSR